MNEEETFDKYTVAEMRAVLREIRRQQEMKRLADEAKWDNLWLLVMVNLLALFCIAGCLALMLAANTYLNGLF